MRFVLVSFFVVGCSRDLGIDKDVGVAPGDTSATYDCSGLLDACEKEACEACVDRCGVVFAEPKWLNCLWTTNFVVGSNLHR